MARTLNKLNVKLIAATTEPGWYGDGGGLWLRITKDGSRRWVLVSIKGGKRKEMGLGAAADVTLAKARAAAAEARAAIDEGRDPIAERAAKLAPLPVEAKPDVVTFGDFADDYLDSVEGGWKNAVHRKQWRSTLRDYAPEIRKMAIADVGTDDVLAALKPIWLTKAETAKRVRGRIEKVLDAAKARGLRPRDSMNPAAWRGHLALLLPKQSKLARGHHAALPYADAPAFMKALRSRPAASARCLEFTILTAARSGEALGATWGEIDMVDRTWTIPGNRMKAGEEHVVPLSTAAIVLLESVRPQAPKDTDIVFGMKGAPRSNMAMAMLLKRMEYGHATTHGFRSTFRDWAGDMTEYPRELIEQALAHTIQNKAERAYRRGTAIKRRMQLMEDWAAYLAG
jgi:integrase